MKGFEIHNAIVGAEILVNEVLELKRKTDLADGYTCEVTLDFLTRVERIASTYLDMLGKTEYNKA